MLWQMRTRTKPVGWLKVGLGVRVAERLSVVVEDDGWPFTARLDVVVENFRPVVEAVTLRRVEGAADGVNADALRALPVGAIVRSSVRSAVDFASRPSPILEADARDLHDDDRLRRVAVVYRLATLDGSPATQAVAADLGVSRPTAGRLIARARDAGHLGAALGTRAGEAS